MLAAGDALAESVSGLRLSGYGTVGVVWDDRNDIVAIRDITQRPGAYDEALVWKRDTRLGLQAEYQVSPQFDLVGQAVWREQEVQDVGHAIELAYVGWKPSPQLDVRFGRIGYDAFLMSDTRNIGYAYSWVRPFTEYYGWIPIFSIDGIDAAYSFATGDARWKFKVQGGRSKVGIPIGYGKLDFKGEGLATVSVSRQSGPWQIKVAMSRFRSANEVSPGDLTGLQDGLGMIATATAGLAPSISREAAELRQHLSFKDLKLNSATLGVAYDDGRWLAQAEWSRTEADHHIAPHGTMGYALVGRRHDDWTHFAGLSVSRPGNGLRGASADWSLIGQAATQAIAILNLNSTRIDQSTAFLGARWDITNQVALKAQWDHTRTAARGYGLLFKEPVLDGRSSRMNQLSLTCDFAF